MKINFGRQKERKINILFIYPNKDVSIFTVDATKKNWDAPDAADKTMYLIDETAIYFWKKKPILIYRHGVASPIRFGDAGEVEYALKASEVKAVIESKAMYDLLHSDDDAFDWTMILAGAAAALSLVQVLISFHVIKPG